MGHFIERRRCSEPDLRWLEGAAEGLLLWESLGYQCMIPFLRSCKKRDVDSVFLVNMMSASKAAMAKDEKIRWQVHEWHLWGWRRIEDIWRVHSHRCVWLNFSQINKFTLPEGRERGLKIREACSIPLTLLSDEEISRLNKSLMMLAGKLWKWLKATLRRGVLLLRKIMLPPKSCLYSGQVLSWTNRF